MGKIINIPETHKKRVVIVGGGFAGLELAQRLAFEHFQVVMIDKNNYHQFQPLFYQVATSGLEPSSIAFPLRKVFQKRKNIHFRIAELLRFDEQQKVVFTSVGDIPYDYLILSTGVGTNFFGNKNIEKYAIPMKTVAEAVYLRNRILRNFEEALNIADTEEQNRLMNIAIVGGGPTGVELAGALAEMKTEILPKDYPELDFSKMKIHLYEGTGQLLNGMSTTSSKKAVEYLTKLGVDVHLNELVSDYDGQNLFFKDGRTFPSNTLIWAAGVSGRKINGISDELYVRGLRVKTDEFSRVETLTDVFAIGDASYMETPKYPKGHPQVAQVAIQQARRLASNMNSWVKGKNASPFRYVDKGSMATIGRARAVVDLPYGKVQGFLAWFLWLFVHLIAIIGVRNKAVIFVNWVFGYIKYDQALRLLIRHKTVADSNKKEHDEDSKELVS